MPDEMNKIEIRICIAIRHCIYTDKAEFQFEIIARNLVVYNIFMLTHAEEGEEKIMNVETGVGIRTSAKNTANQR
jgi:hypothetical protein